MTLPTIKLILEKGASPILMSHLGRPRGVLYGSDLMKGQEKWSLLPVAKRLEYFLKCEDGDSAKPVLFAPDCMNAEKLVEAVQPGQVLVLENLRYYSNEGSRNFEERKVMAQKLASYGDHFVSDAFGTSHRVSATMTGIPKVLRSGVAGLLMQKEIEAFSTILADPPRPLVAVVGGSKVSDKIQLFENLITKIDKLLIGGSMAYTFLSSQGYEIGKSFSQAGQSFIDRDGNEVDMTELAGQLIEKAQAKGVEVCLPIDHVCHTGFGSPRDGEDVIVTTDANVPDNLMAMDIGPKTVEYYRSKIQECQAAIWNGPMGVFEIETYSKGTYAIAEVIGNETQTNGLLSIVGGGDTASAAERSGHAGRMHHISTGGIPSLQLLEGKSLPGIRVLNNRPRQPLKRTRLLSESIELKASSSSSEPETTAASSRASSSSSSGSTDEDDSKSLPVVVATSSRNMSCCTFEEYDESAAKSKRIAVSPPT